MTEFLARGELTHGNWTNEMKEKFMTEFGSALGEDFERQFKRIINSSVSRIRTCSHFKQLGEAGFDFAEIIENDTACEICREMHGKLIPVNRVNQIIDKFVSAESLEEGLEWIKNTSIKDVEEAKLDINKLLADGRGFPPYHPECKGRVRGKKNE